MNVGILKKSEDLALFLGMLTGDGCLPIKRNGNGYRVYPINFYNTDKRQIHLFNNLFKKIFNLEGHIQTRQRKNRKRQWIFEKYSVKLYKIINNEFEIGNGKKALKAKIPSFILNGNDELKKFFFLGLLITDGRVGIDRSIIFNCASKKLMYDLKQLVKDVWDFDRPIYHYIQKNKFNVYRLILNKIQGPIILSQLPGSHNLVVRGIFLEKTLPKVRKS